MHKIYAMFATEGSAVDAPLRCDSAQARKLVDDYLPSVAHYRQFARAPAQLDGGQDAPFAASAEFWVRDANACQAVVDFLHSAAAVQSGLFSVAPSLVEHCEEHNIMGAAFVDSGFKCTFLFNRKPDMDLGAFHHHWLHTHGPIAARTENAERYVQSHITAADRRYDGITELFWADHPTAVASMASEQMRADQASDAQNFVDTESLIAFLATEVP